MKERIIQILKEQLLPPPSFVTVEDESPKHANHKEARYSGGGHYFLVVVSDAFVQKSLIARHRMIYDLLGALMKQDVHALGIKAYTEAEWKHKNG